MLSVGVDIQRLGLMMINGQPKNHSEYIQASGRIGRRAPGLIITLYNPLKPRDLSHYENFKYYHSTFFKNVEPISLTPFAKRARDAGLFGVLVGLIRNLVPIMASNTSAKRMRLNNTQIKNQIDEIKNEFSSRVGIIDPPELQSTLDQIDSLFKLWEKYATFENTPLIYKATQYTKKAEKQNNNYLLKSIEQGQQGLKEIPATPMSLREAEQEQQLYYFNGDDSDVPE
jgi:Helicase conserved C-terminal domain.